MMKSRHLLGIVVFVSVLMTTLLSGPAYAITNGQSDGDAHPYVGMVVVWDGDTEGGVYLGSGSLIAPQVVLTAGHMTADEPDYIITNVWVSFGQPASWPPPYWGSGDDWKVASDWYTHPEYEIYTAPQLTDWISHDIGIIILEEPVVLDVYANLPEEGLVDELEMMDTVDQVGYGVQTMLFEPGVRPDWGWIEPGARYYAPAQLIKTPNAFIDEFITLTANPAQGKGGTAFGDSGGPNLQVDTDTILAVTSWGTNYQCAGVSYAARVDTADVLEWINGFL